MKTIKLNPWWREICHTWMVWVYWAWRKGYLHQTAHFNTRQISRIFATRHGIVGKEIRFQSGTGHVFEKHQSTLPPEQPFEKHALIPANPRLNTSTWRFLHVPTTTLNEINAYRRNQFFSWYFEDLPNKTSWWFQPTWKILVKMGIFPK